MKFARAISEIQGRISRNRKTLAAMIVLTGLGACALCFVILSHWSTEVALTCTAAALLGLSLIVWKKGLFSPVSRYDAALFLDGRFSTSERAVSYVEIEKDGQWADPRAEILLGQLEERIPEFSVDELLPLSISRRQKITFSLGLLTWIALFVLLVFWNPFSPKTAGAKDARIIQDLLKEEKAIPPELRRKLEELARDLQKEETGSARLKESLKAAEQELENARQSEGETSSGESQDNPESVPAPTPTPVPPAVASAQALKPSPTPTVAVEKQSRKDKQDKSEKDQEKSEEQSKQGQSGRSEQSDQPEESEQGQDDKGQQGQGNKEQKQSGSGAGQSKDSKEQQKEGQSQGQGEGKEGKDQGGKQSQGQGEQQQNQSLQKTEQALNQIKENQNQQKDGSKGEKGEQGDKKEGQGEQKNQPGKDQQKSDGEKKEQSGKSGADSQQKQGKEEGEKPEAGEKGESKGADKKDEQAKEGQSSSEAKETADKKSFEEKKAGQSSLASPEEQEKRRGQSPLGDKETGGIGGDKGYRDMELNPQGEKYDTSQTGKDAGTSGQRVEARPRTSLSDVELARPEIVKEKASQPVPLEYKDLLR